VPSCARAPFAAVDSGTAAVLPCWSRAYLRRGTLRHLVGHDGIGSDLRVAAGLARSVPRFLRNPLTVSDARRELASRLARREHDFLAFARDAIYGYASSIYRQLLRHAGCEPGDLERLVRQEGLEGALCELLASGVHLTVDEAKGRRPVVRGSLVVEPASDMLLNPLAARHVPVASSGSRGAQSPLLMDLAFVRDQGVNVCLAVDAAGGSGWAKAVWEVPGGAALYRQLKLSSFGSRVARWFTQVDPRDPDVHPRYRWCHRVVRWASVAAGLPLPVPVYAPLDDSLPVARWLAEVVRRGGTPWVRTFPSSAVRACQAAVGAGIDLTGARFTVAGEPVTAAKLAAIRRSGAHVSPRYGTVETGSLAWGCLAPESPDDMHVFHDLHAIVQPDDSPSLWVTSLRRSAPLVMLNVSMGDQATLRPRACGCPLEPLGWTTHVHGVVSREKLTAGGMTFYDTDVVRVLEQALPARFGGGPTDYQLVEEESESGEPVVRLLVHPAVGPLDPAQVAEAFLSALGGGSGAERIMGTVWRDAGLLRVERRPPIAAASGKVLHLHVVRHLALAAGVGV
jgi:hypothetical protein